MHFLMDPHQRHQQQNPPPPPPPQPQPQPPAAAGAQPLHQQAPPHPVQLMFQQPSVLLGPSQHPPAPPQQQQELPVPASGGGAFPAPPAAGQAQILQPTPNLVSAPVGNHPPYDEMITEAIKALNEKDGSSKRAIAGYIDRVYPNSLPETHSALLTAHLKRLKEVGLVVMVKHSYKLPGADNGAVPPARSSPVDPIPASNPAANGPKRRGRPPKAKTPVPASVQAASVDPAAIPVLVRGSAPVTNPGPNADPASVFVSLGLVDGPIPVPMSVSDPSMARRRRGRPKKTETVGAPPALQVKATLAKRTPGRPRKVAAKNAANAAVGSGAVIPPKVHVPKLKKDGTLMKPRGRPPRKNVDVSVPVPVPVSAAAGAAIAPAVYVGEGALTVIPAPGAAPGAKRRGRPSTKALKVQNGPKKHRKRSGKPLGRPRKFAVQGANTQQVVPYDELKRKLELYQLKIKQSVNTLKPHLDGNPNAAGALTALKELEDLANGESGAPTQQPPPLQGQQPPVQS